MFYLKFHPGSTLSGKRFVFGIKIPGVAGDDECAGEWRSGWGSFTKADVDIFRKGGRRFDDCGGAFQLLKVENIRFFSAAVKCGKQFPLIVVERLGTEFGGTADGDGGDFEQIEVPVKDGDFVFGAAFGSEMVEGDIEFAVDKSDAVDAVKIFEWFDFQ